MVAYTAKNLRDVLHETHMVNGAAELNVSEMTRAVVGPVLSPIVHAVTCLAAFEFSGRAHAWVVYAPVNDPSASTMFILGDSTPDLYPINI